MTTTVVERDDASFDIKRDGERIAKATRTAPGLFKVRFKDGSERLIRVREQWMKDELIEALDGPRAANTNEEE